MATFGSPSPSAGGHQSMIAPDDGVVPEAGTDSTSSLIWTPAQNQNYLVSGNWDGGVRCWEAGATGQSSQNGQPPVPSAAARALAKVTHENNAPVLDVCFSADGSTVFSVGADKAVRMWQLGQTPPNNLAQQIGVHDAPIKSVGFIPSSNLVVSGGWDRKLKFWDTRSPQPAGELMMEDRVYDLDVQGRLMVAAIGNRQIIIYDVSGPTPVMASKKESPLKYQTRCVRCFPDQTGFAVGSIEGRVGIQYVQKPPGKDHFAFKCHRDGNNVYSVNSMAFQNIYGTFATTGSDGVVTFWDKDNKQRLKAFPPLSQSVPCSAFNSAGNLFAYAVCYDWNAGATRANPNNHGSIYVHYTPDDEVKPKLKKSR